MFFFYFKIILEPFQPQLSKLAVNNFQQYKHVIYFQIVYKSIKEFYAFYIQERIPTAEIGRIMIQAKT